MNFAGEGQGSEEPAAPLLRQVVLNTYIGCVEKYFISLLIGTDVYVFVSQNSFAPSGSISTPMRISTKQSKCLTW